MPRLCREWQQTSLSFYAENKLNWTEQLPSVSKLTKTWSTEKIFHVSEMVVLSWLYKQENKASSCPRGTKASSEMKKGYKTVSWRHVQSLIILALLEDVPCEGRDNGKQEDGILIFALVTISQINFLWCTRRENPKRERSLVPGTAWERIMAHPSPGVCESVRHCRAAQCSHQWHSISVGWREPDPQCWQEEMIILSCFN